MRLASLDALASVQAINRNPSLDFALVGCSGSLGSRRGTTYGSARAARLSWPWAAEPRAGAL